MSVRSLGAPPADGRPLFASVAMLAPGHGRSVAGTGKRPPQRHDGPTDSDRGRISSVPTLEDRMNGQSLRDPYSPGEADCAACDTAGRSTVACALARDHMHRSKDLAGLHSRRASHNEAELVVEIDALLQGGPLFPEWSEPQPSQPVHQGDVLVSLRPDVDHWRGLVVVLTADCDLAKAKHGGALSCVPLLNHAKYLTLFRFDKIRDSLSERLVQQLLEVHQCSLDSPHDLPHISESRMREWIVEADVEAIVSTLQLKGNAASRFTELATATRSLLTEPPITVGDAVDVLAAAKFALGDVKTHEKGRGLMASEFSSSLRTLPGDALFLNQVSPEHTAGYVAYLRRVIEVSEGSVVRTSSRLPHDAQYLRISRMRPPYVYAMSQQFGSVFSAIGLPPEYEAARASALERLKNMEDWH